MSSAHYLPTPLVDEVAAVNAALVQMPHPDPSTPDGLAMLREATFAPSIRPVLEPSGISIAGPSGDLELRVIRPTGRPRAVMYNIHGGGNCIGHPRDDDWFNDLLARESQVAVVSPRYRLAPEHPFPAGVDDCIAGADWLVENALTEFGTDSLLVGGGSAGAYLAAQVLLRIRGAGVIDRVVGANLLFGQYDVSGTPSARAATPETLVLTSQWIEAFQRNTFPGRRIDELQDEQLSPLYADLADMPPALFTVGELDPLLDDSLFMAARWRAAGSRADLDVWPSCVHGFTNLAPETGRRAWMRMSSWLSTRLDELELS